MSKLIPTADERKKILYHLKKCSSITAWSRLLPLYKAWADILEKSIVKASDNATIDKPARLGTQELIVVLKGFSTFEKCIASLLDGDKSPFRHNGPICFYVAHKPISTWGEIWSRGERFSDIMHEPSLVPYWEKILIEREKLSRAWAEIGPAILDNSDPTDEAVFDLLDSHRDFFFVGLSYKALNDEIFPAYQFPPSLPEVPDPKEVVLIGYGDYVPCSGIWEPVKAEVPKRKIISLFSKPDMPSGPFEVVGCMNYLHEHSTAPHIGEGREPIPTTWRLLWKDDRYMDGTIPKEEADYVFNEPRERSPAASSSTINTNDSIIFARSGERAIKEGVWAVQEDLNARQTFALNDALPQHNGHDVTWVFSGN